MKPIVLLAALACAASTAATAAPRAELPRQAEIVDPAGLPAAADGAAAQLADWSALADAGRFDALRAAIAQAPTGAATELALSRLVLHLQDGAAGRSAGGRALLASLAGRAPLLWQRHEETAGDWFVPVVDPGAEAASALAMLDREARRDAWLAQWRSKPDAALAALAAPEGRLAARDAIEVAGARDLDALAKAWRTGAALPPEVLAGLARRRADARLYAAAVEAAPAQLAVRLVADAPRVLGEAAMPLLDAAAGRRDTASAAVLAMAPLAGQPAVRQRLLGWLGDPALGPSAASALARGTGDGTLDAASIVREIEAAARADAAKAAPAAALALRLIDTAAARAALGRIAADPETPAALRQEIAR